MGDRAVLLRMLEPAVRPTSGQTPGNRAERGGRLPLEEQDFESLLAEFGGEADQAMDGETLHGDQRGNPLTPLTQPDAIENPSLRALMAARAGENPDQAASAAEGTPPWD